MLFFFYLLLLSFAHCLSVWPSRQQLTWVIRTGYTLYTQLVKLREISHSLSSILYSCFGDIFYSFITLILIFCFTWIFGIHKSAGSHVYVYTTLSWACLPIVNEYCSLAVRPQQNAIQVIVLFLYYGFVWFFYLEVFILLVKTVFPIETF